MKKKEQVELLDEWQWRLGLWDWRIALEPKCKPDELENKDAQGEVSCKETTKTAIIRIIKPKYYENRVIPFDWEEVLVHELMHLKMCLLEDEVEPLQERVAHILVDDLARALVDAKRSGTKQEEAE